PGAPPGSRGLSHRDPHPEGGEVRSLLSALHSSARAAPAHPTTLSSPSPLLRSSGPHQLTPVRCPGKSDALYARLCESVPTSTGRSTRSPAIVVRTSNQSCCACTPGGVSTRRRARSFGTP